MEGIMSEAFETGGSDRLACWRHPARGTAWAQVLLVHGMGEHSGRHLNLTERLVAAGADVVRFDLRGCGRSAGEAQWIDRFDDYLDDVHAVRKAMATPERMRLPLLLYGHSLGGCVALHYAARHGTGLAGLVLSAPAFRPGQGVSPVKIAVGRLVNKILPHVRIPGALELAAISRDPAVVAAYAADPHTSRFNTVRQGDEILKALDRVPEACARIATPTLIVHGDADRLVRVEGSREILAKLAATDKRLSERKGGYHELHNDLCKDEVLDEIVAWMRAHA
jgi:alpha-beta hydrolase superfamily lysophospholipase